MVHLVNILRNLGIVEFILIHIYLTCEIIKDTKTLFFWVKISKYNLESHFSQQASSSLVYFEELGEYFQI